MYIKYMEKRKILKNPKPATPHTAKLGHLDGTKPMIYLGLGPAEREILKSGSRADTGRLSCLLTEFTLTMSNYLLSHKVKYNNFKMLKQLQKANRNNFS